VLPNENMNFPRAGELHTRAGRQAAPQDGQVGCGKGRAEGLPFSAVRLALFRSPPARPSALCAAAGRKFMFFIWQHSPPGPPISVIRHIWTEKASSEQD